ncbi:MAG TPA: hypothetical protein VFW62_00445, partial [bacterium]|nr:hypothetical protein [bacterium]
MRDFKADWDSRPHFTEASQVPVQRTKLPYNNILQRFVDKVRETMAARPNLAGLRHLLNEPKNRTDISLRLERPDALGTTLYFNWRQVGFKVRFTALGHLTGAIEVRQPFSQGESVAEIEALPAEPVQMPTSGRPRRKNRAAPAKPAASRPTAPSPHYGPRRGENPTEWAMRLLEASRSEDRDAAHQIVLEMERQLADPATQQMTRDMVERLVVLTGPDSHSPRSGLVARQYKVSALRSPITIVSEPTTFLPDPWSQVFAEGLASVKREAAQTQVPLAIEAGSGTGWASIVLSRLGLAGEIVATDLNPRAPALGRVNAALNGVSNVRFFEG